MDRAFALYEAPLLLGSVLSCPLFGITLAQTIRYFRVYSESDRLSLKLFVLALLLLDGLQTFSISSASKAIFLAAKITYGYETGILITVTIIELVCWIEASTGTRQGFIQRRVTVFAAIDVITWVATQDTLLFMVFFIFLSKLYVNSMLVTLRARRDLLEASEDIGPTTEKPANDERI
ncbi:hypothetical protein ONZ45_g8038 [Pleurotus djamor]|nr:hypothetical protein ONZ45_g8038 [Pleurotus djamor]